MTMVRTRSTAMTCGVMVILVAVVAVSMVLMIAYLITTTTLLPS